MSAQQVVFQYLSAGSNTLTVPAGFSNQVLVYAWGAAVVIARPELQVAVVDLHRA
jgi:hypothetical protein